MTGRAESDLFVELIGAPAACLDLAARGTLCVTGSDRVRFLNGMLTNDVAALATGEVCPALQLDRKGHVLAELQVIARESEIWLDVSPGGEERLLETLDRHVIADDVEIRSYSATHGQLAIEGPGAAEAARELGGAQVEPGRCQETTWRDVDLLWIGGGNLTQTGRRVIALRTEIAPLVAALNLPRIDEDVAEILRIDGFRPKLGVDVSERNFPQEARLDHALSFTKGCYIGQEIVARIDSRGAVNRLLVKLATSSPVGRDDEIAADGKPVGTVTSVAVSPRAGPLALGYVKKASAAPGTRLEIAGVAAEVIGPLPETPA